MRHAEQARADRVHGHRVQFQPHDQILVGLVADHEVVAAGILEAVALVEAVGAGIFGEDRQVDLVGAAARAPRRCTQSISSPADAGAVPGLEHVELAQLDRRALRLDRQRRRTDLGIGDRLAFHLAEPDREARIGELGAPALLAVILEEGREILGRVEMAEGLDEGLAAERRDDRPHRRARRRAS